MGSALGKLLAFGFWLWAGFIAVAAGFLGAILNACDNGCEDGFPSLLEPWTWGDYYFYPEVSFIAFSGLVVASVSLLLVVKGRRLYATFALLGSLALLSYPFFAGLTAQGRAGFFFGPLLGIAAVAVMRSGNRELS